MESSIISLEDEAQQVPERLPILPLDGLVVFPHVVLPLAISTPHHVALIDEVLQSHKLVTLAALKPGREDTEADEADPPFFGAGTLAQIVRMMKLPDGSVRMLIHGRSRLQLQAFQKRGDWWIARVQELQDTNAEGPETEALRRAVATIFQEIITLSPALSDELIPVLNSIAEGSKLADFVAANSSFDLETRQLLLAQPDVRARLERVAELLGEEREILEYRSQIQNRVKTRVERSQREYWLREQMREIQSELGEGESGETTQLRTELEAAELSDDARAQAEKELARLERMNPQSAEYQVVRTYLDWLMDLPWRRESEESVELERARRVLDRDHYDLEKIKERIVEYLAVRKLNPGMQGPILCFVGPPGVGKTSLGRSIAEALGRTFVRISLGGVRDEAEIRGHRRTYVGAMPGRIIQALKTANVRNPVFMLDEIDKIGQDFRGDPTAALLEVLDPAQNDTFVDHYLEIPFDLSRIIFIATANTLSTIPRPLLDRMEVLHLSAYAPGEKFHIARRYLVPRQLAEHGLSTKQVTVSDGALQRLVAEYTREAGVRGLERMVARLMRKAAVEVVEGAEETIRVTQRNLPRYVGSPRFHSEIAGREDEVGVATGLAWTPVGGDILFIEAVRMPGKGNISLTGQLGDVMKESAQAAFSFLRSTATAWDVPEETFRSSDIHLHVPAGATPKDGPSAGVAMATALASLLTGRPVRRDVAMTGEITLRGHVLPVGGIREKVIAAERAGIRRVLLPARNEPDVEDIPEEVRAALEITFADHVDEVFRIALGTASKEARDRSRRGAGDAQPAAAAPAAEGAGT
jgi:ATP-dependent Lon protease